MSKISNGLQARQGNQVQYDGDCPGEGISIALVENDPSANTTWLILVWCRIDQGEFFLGGFTTNTALVDGSPARFVGFASCPGAKGWRIEAVNNFAPLNNDFDAQLFVQAGKCCAGGGQMPGVFQPPQPPGSGGDPHDGGGFTPPVPPT